MLLHAIEISAMISIIKECSGQIHTLLKHGHKNQKQTPISQAPSPQEDAAADAAPEAKMMCGVKITTGCACTARCQFL